jgi:FkbM family methyltransferase
MDIIARFEEIIKNTKEPVIFEIGACDGYHTNILYNIAKKYHQSFKYFAFEPDKRLNESFKINNKNNQVEFLNLAFGSENKEVTFYLSSGEESRPGYVKQRFYGSSSIKKPKLVTQAWPDMKFEETKVKCTTIDEFCRTNKIEKIDFIWMDTQGAEKDIFSGLGSMKEKIRFIFTEYCNAELYEGEIGLNQICSMLNIFNLIQDYKGDALFERKQSKRKK